MFISLMLFQPIIVAGDLWLPSFFADQMVLQQQMEVPLWGKATPGTEVTVSTNWGINAKTFADNSGKWKIKIKTPSAGGPYAVTIRTSDAERTLTDVLIGEVWICSGQSNMEMPLAGWPPRDTIMGSAKEIANANNPYLRTFTVTRAYSIVPVDSCMGQWMSLNKQTAGQFSATAYFFGKKLYETLKVPIGLIHTSWGGTPAEAWTPQEALADFTEFSGLLNNIPSLTNEYLNLCDWIKSHPTITPEISDPNRWKNLNLNDSIAKNPFFNDSLWPVMKLPVLWEQGGIGDFDGVVWFRKTVNIPSSWVGNELELSLGMIDDMDATYFNGVKVGGYEEAGFWQTPRKYRVPAALVRGELANISVRVIDNQGGGGIWGKPEEMYLINVTTNEKIAISGEWKYMPVGEFMSDRIYVYNISNGDFFKRPKISIVPGPSLPSFLYNAMIHPLVPYGIRGAIWYQGEANVGRATQYAKLFPTMIESWRKVWQQGDFPFYFVQLAPWEYSGVDNDDSGWLRESQRRTLSLPNTGMAVTLDVGDVKNIHPPYKREVGERLALWALAKTYNKKMVYSGPLYQGAIVKGDKMYITFTGVGSGLKLSTQQPKEFEIAGENQKFYPAMVRIENDRLVVWSPLVKSPVYVRYAMRNGAQAELFNKEGLPASGFTTQDMQK
ncbi:MAG: 9-O-acetylesterase [Bacteroidales bacterium]|nr:9-O-acetylesterase [Bacteroidales bacterium]